MSFEPAVGKPGDAVPEYVSHGRGYTVRAVPHIWAAAATTGSAGSPGTGPGAIYITGATNSSNSPLRPALFRRRLPLP
jgi:hypothetical protein